MFREQEVPSSNLGAPTISLNNLASCSIRWGSIKGFQLNGLFCFFSRVDMGADAVRSSTAISKMRVDVLGHRNRSMADLVSHDLGFHSGLTALRCIGMTKIMPGEAR